MEFSVLQKTGSPLFESRTSRICLRRDDLLRYRVIARFLFQLNELNVGASIREGEREMRRRKLTRRKILLNNDITTPSRSKYLEDIQRVRGNGNELVQEIGNPHLVPTNPLNDRRRTSSVVVCKSVSNYGLARLASGCSDFNPFGEHIRHRIFIASPLVFLYFSLGLLAYAIQCGLFAKRGSLASIGRYN